MECYVVLPIEVARQSSLRFRMKGKASSKKNMDVIPILEVDASEDPETLKEISENGLGRAQRVLVRNSSKAANILGQLDLKKISSRVTFTCDNPSKLDQTLNVAAQVGVPVVALEVGTPLEKGSFKELYDLVVEEGATEEVDKPSLRLVGPSIPAFEGIRGKLGYSKDTDISGSAVYSCELKDYEEIKDSLEEVPQKEKRAVGASRSSRGSRGTSASKKKRDKAVTTVFGTERVDF